MSASAASLRAKHMVSRILHRYADWRIGATSAEKRCYKPSDTILLTFDDCGTAEQVDSLLEILRRKRVKAVFFVQGDWAARDPVSVERIRRSGHVVANHTATHKVLKGLPQQEIIEEINGSVPSRWLRPPEGRYDKRVRAIAGRLGYRLCYWTIDSRDWTGASVSAMRHTILDELSPGAVILFHIHGRHTAGLLSSLIDDIRARGYRLTDFTEKW